MEWLSHEGCRRVYEIPVPAHAETEAERILERLGKRTGEEASRRRRLPSLPVIVIVLGFIISIPCTIYLAEVHEFEKDDLVLPGAMCLILYTLLWVAWRTRGLLHIFERKSFQPADKAE